MLVRGLPSIGGRFARHVDEVAERLEAASRCSHRSLESHGASTVEASAVII